MRFIFPSPGTLGDWRSSELGTASRGITGTVHPSPSFVNPNRGVYEIGSEVCTVSCVSSFKYFQKFWGKIICILLVIFTNEIR